MRLGIYHTLYNVQNNYQNQPIIIWVMQYNQFNLVQSIIIWSMS